MREMLDKPHGWFRTWFRKVWKLRGGGLCAAGFAHFGFSSYLKKPIENWMFADAPEAAEEAQP